MVKIKSNKNFQIALLASDNGIGHIKRIISLSNILSKQINKFEITCYIDLEKLKKLKKEIKISKLAKYKNYKPNIEKILKRKNKFQNIYLTIPNLKRYDLIISDNIVEVAQDYDNLIIICNFLWAYILDDLEYHLKVVKLLQRKNLIIIQNYLFGMPFPKIKKKINKVAFFEFNRNNFITNKEKSILISLGNTVDSTIDVTKIINELISHNVFKIYLEPRYYKTNMPKNVVKFDYSSTSYSKIEIAIIRPGLGTLNNCFKHNILILTLKSTNKEMKYNSKILVNLKLGMNYKNFNSIKSILALKNKFLNKYKSLQFENKYFMNKIIESNFL